jgi:glycosyltransferase involved in cell wall biosynthesis
MRVLYVSHTAHVSGAEEALCDLLEGLPPEVERVAAIPRGPLSDRVGALGVPVMDVTATDGSLRLHPAWTTQALVQLTGAGLQVRRAAAKVRADVVHANSIRAGLSASLATRLGAPRALVHVHDCLPPGPVSTLTRRTIGRHAATVVANSAHTARRFDTGSFHADMRVVHYGIDANRFDPARIDRASARARLDLDDGDVALAVVGQLTPWKGQDHAIRVLARVREHGSPARLFLAGSAKFVSRATRHDNPTYVRDLHELTRALGVGEHVTFLGQSDDVPALLRGIDVALVPSWEEPFGRAVTEALAMAVPVVATDVGGPAEVIAAGEDGFVLPPRDLDRWTETVELLAREPRRRATMGERGRARVTRRYSMPAYVEGMIEAYTYTLRR